MPLNKFNQHYLISSSSCSDEIVSSPSPLLNAPFYICDSFDYHVKCLIRIRGEKKTSLNKSFYVLDNGGTGFKFPLSAKIESVSHYKADGDVLINNKSFKFHELHNTNINKGDVLTFKLGTPSNICIELLIQCPLVKNV